MLSGRSAIGLDTHGRAQAGRLVDRLADVPIAAIHSSPQRRAVETADPLATARDLAVTIAPALDEVDFGSWKGRSFDDLASDPDWQEWNARRGATTPPAGERMDAATDRAYRHLQAAATGIASGALLCVTHCDIIRGVVAHCLGLDTDRLLSFDVDPCSVTTIALHPGGGRVVALNERLP